MVVINVVSPNSVDKFHHEFTFNLDSCCFRSRNGTEQDSNDIEVERREDFLLRIWPHAYALHSDNFDNSTIQRMLRMRMDIVQWKVVMRVCV